jgi:hypothetical protein
MYAVCSEIGKNAPVRVYEARQYIAILFISRFGASFQGYHILQETIMGAGPVSFLLKAAYIEAEISLNL